MIDSERQAIGFSVRSFDDIERVTKLDIDCLEIALSDFNTCRNTFYYFERGFFSENFNLLRRIRMYANPILGKKTISIQQHLPLCKKKDNNSLEGLNIGLLEHHDIYIEYLVFLERIYRAYGVGSMNTLHPPPLAINEDVLMSEEENIRNINIFLRRMDDIRFKDGYQSKLCLENLTDPKNMAPTLAHLPENIAKMMEGVKTIELTVDTGHLQLSSESSFEKILNLGIPIGNFHFHGNKGEFDPNTWTGDDQHLPPNRETLKDYEKYISFFKKKSPQIIIELMDLNRYSDRDLKLFIKNLREELEEEKIEELTTAI